MLETRDLSFQYPGERLLTFPDLTASPGNPLLILGASGSGKSTLLHLLAGLMKPNQGDINIAGTNITSLSGRKLDQFRGQNIGIIFQRSHFVESLTVNGNLDLANFLPGMKINSGRRNALLTQLDISSRAELKPSNLSIGEQQRVAIARALMNQPDVLLADEPTSALDDVNCQKVIDLLKQTAKESNATLVVVTHDQRIKDQFSHQISLT